MENNNSNTICLNHTEWYMVYLGPCIMFESFCECLRLMLMSLGISTNCMFGWMSTGFPEHNANLAYSANPQPCESWLALSLSACVCMWVCKCVCVGVHICYDSTDGRDRQQRRETGWGSITYPDKAFTQTWALCWAFTVSLLHSHDTSHSPLAPTLTAGGQKVIHCWPLGVRVTTKTAQSGWSRVSGAAFALHKT